MKRIVFFILLLSGLAAHSQTVYPIAADTVKIAKTGGNAELVLMNATRNLVGAFLRNRGNGRTEYAFALDSVYWSGDSLAFKRGGQVLKFRVAGTTTGGGVTGYTFSDPLLLQGNNVTLQGWNRAKWDSTYNWWKSGPLQDYYTKAQIEAVLGGSATMQGYNKTNWDLAFQWLNSGLYVKKSDLDTMTNTGALEFSNGLIKTGNKVNALPDNALWNAKKLQGYKWSSVQPENGATPVFNAVTQTWEFGKGADAQGYLRMKFTGNLAGQYTIDRTVQAANVDVYINGLYIEPSCYTVNVNLIQLNFSCLTYSTDENDIVLIKYK